MNRFPMMFAVCASMAAPALFAQAKQAPPPQNEIAMLKGSYTAIKNNLMKAAERMPEENYGFKASPDIRTFGQLVGHVADAQKLFCSRVSGGPGPTEQAEKTKTAKADLVAVLKESFDQCDAVFNGLADDDLTKMITAPNGAQTSKTGTLWRFIIGHSNEEYGYLAVYMRIKGIVPPSTQP